MFWWVELHALCHATEEEGRVEEAIRFLGGQGEVKAQGAEGFHGNPIRFLVLRLEREPEKAAFWDRVATPENVASWRRELAERLDEDGVLHLRFDKQEAYAQRVAAATHADAIDVRAKVKAFPAKRGVALAALDQELVRRGAD